MKHQQALKLRIVVSAIGVILLLAVMVYFIRFDLANSKRSAGTYCLGLLICFLLYGYVYMDIRLLRNENLQTIFRGLDVPQTVTVGLIFLIGTVVSTIFRPHVIVPLIGLSLVAFSITHGLRFIVFDHSSRTVDGLIDRGKTAFDNLRIVSTNERIIEVNVLDSGQTVVLKRETCSDVGWTRIISNCNQMTS